jgi:hypothetical protein
VPRALEAGPLPVELEYHRAVEHPQSCPTGLFVGEALLLTVEIQICRFAMGYTMDRPEA